MKQRRRMLLMRRHKKKKNNDLHVDETWLIPYSDLLTLLLALFIVLFAMSQVDETKASQLSTSLRIAFQGSSGVLKFENPIQPPIQVTNNDQSTVTNSNNAYEPITEANRKYQEETRKLTELAERLNQYLEENNLVGALTTEVSEQGLKITIEEKALFNSGKAVMLPDARKLAIQISSLLVEVPAREITISGHTDDVPMNSREFKSNWELSSARANNFLHIVLENSNLDKTNFKTTGYADNRPIADNSTMEGRAKNRRVEVMIERIYNKDE